MGPTKKGAPADGYEVGYGRPPINSRFSSTQQPARRGRKKTPNSNEVLDILNEEMEIRKDGRKVKMSSFEIATRKLVEKALNERNLDNAIEFLALCEQFKLVQRPPCAQSGPVLVCPNNWDWDEWVAMFHKYGAPPWPGPRSGLTEHSEGRVSSSTRPPSGSNAQDRRLHAACGVDPTKPIGHANPPRASQFKPGRSGNPNGRPSRDKTQKAIVESIAFEIHVVSDGNRRTERTVLELLLLMIRSIAHKGNRKAFQIQKRLLKDYGFATPARERAYLLVPKVMSLEEWDKLAEEQQRPYREVVKT